MKFLKDVLYEKLDSFFGIRGNHYLVEINKDYIQLMNEYNSVRDFFLTSNRRAFFRDTDIVPLRHFLRVKKGKFPNYTNILRNYPTFNYELFPKTVEWVKKFAKDRNSSVGWIVFSIIHPGVKVYLHSDTGLYFAMSNRYHFVLKSNGSLMISGGQTKVYKEGEVWWFNNRVPHEAFNHSGEERIHLIFDLLPNNYFIRLKNILLWLYWGLRPGRLWNYYFGRSFPNI